MRSEHLLPGALISSRAWPNPSWRAIDPMMPSPVDPLCVIVQRSRYMGCTAQLLLVGSDNAAHVRYLSYEQVGYHLVLERGAPGDTPKKRQLICPA